jgi:SAM-dependent methyltransferase
VTFEVAGDAYDHFMGLYSRKLAPLLIDFADIRPGMSVLDVGAGSGSLARELAGRVGARHVSACDPSKALVAACATRVPGADVRRAGAEELPWAEGVFDATLAQLVVNFIGDANAGVKEMRRVTRRSGIVAACTWDYAGEMQMLRTFWDAARAVDPDAPDEARTMRFISPGELRDLWRAVGMSSVETGQLVVERTYPDFDDLWGSLTGAVGPAGHYCKSLDEERRGALRDELKTRLGSPENEFTLSARAWAVRGTS